MIDFIIGLCRIIKLVGICILFTPLNIKRLIEFTQKDGAKWRERRELRKKIKAARLAEKGEKDGE